MVGEFVIKDYKRVFWLFEMGRADEVTWTKWPVSRNSTSYRRLMLTPAGRTAFCVFNGIVRLVSRERTGGMLVIRGRAMADTDIHTETGIPLKDVRLGMAMLKSQDIAWIITVEEQIRLDKEREKPGSKPGESGSVDGLKTSQERPPLASRASISLSVSDFSSSGGESERGRVERIGFSGRWDCGTIRAAYPKQVKGRNALVAIDAALNRLEARGQPDPQAWLLGRVQAYAEAVAGQPLGFIKDPPGWFDDERYDDDPAAWKRDERDPGPTRAIAKGEAF